MRKAALLIVTATVALLLAGCTAGPSASTTPLDRVVDLTRASSTSMSAIKQKTDVSQGDTVSTGPHGLAQLVFPDASVTRVGPSSKLKVTLVTAKQAQRTGMTLDIGEIWNRVTKLAGTNSTFKVKTPVGTASVRGTAFAIICKAGPSCEIDVMEGVVLFTTPAGKSFTIHTYQRVVIPATGGGQPSVSPYPVDAVQTSAWISSNLARDSKSHHPSPPAPEDVNAASIAGAWKLNYLVTKSNTAGESVGTKLTTSWTVQKAVCTSTCVSAARSASSSAARISFTHDGDHLTYSYMGTFDCIDPTTRAVLHAAIGTQLSTATVTITAAETINGVYTATSMTAHRHTTLTDDPSRPKCGSLPAVTAYDETVTYSRAG
jgi:hypothetical protein